jgi:cellulose synthase/poly-beta-1,6-N-acetylglucosamine synthase-like glycosyltransferase
MKRIKTALTKMTHKQVAFFILLGFILTIIVSFVPNLLCNLLNTQPTFSYGNIFWLFCLATTIFPICLMVPWAIYYKHNKTPYQHGEYQPKVSLILPAFNEEKIIAQAIEHGLTQDYKGEIEIIVVDDGSTDNTKSIVETYVQKCPNVKLIAKPNGGKPSALNAGFTEATGEISIIQDTDSILVKDFVSKIVPYFSNPKIGLVAGMIDVMNNENTLTLLQRVEYICGQMMERWCQSSTNNVLICPGAATAVRTELGRLIPSTKRTVAEDADFTMSVKQLGYSVAQEPLAISYTEAPITIKALVDQRKRWTYGGLQTFNRHRWALKNPWVTWVWVGYLICWFPLVTIALTLWTYCFNTAILQTMLPYSILSFTVYLIYQATGILLYGKNRIKLLLYFPLYMIYQFTLSALTVYLVFAFVSKIGVHVKYGKENIHAVR